MGLGSLRRGGEGGNKVNLKKQIAADLEVDEGRVRHVYKDSLGYDTIGKGHLVDERLGGGLPDFIIDLLCDFDIDEAMADLDKRLIWWRTMPEAVQRALVNMRFQLGVKLYGFHKMLNALQARDWKEAIAEGQDSLWFTQTPVRARRVLALIGGPHGAVTIDGQDSGDSRVSADSGSGIAEHHIA